MEKKIWGEIHNKRNEPQKSTKQSQWKNPKVTNIQQLFAEWEDDSIRHQELDWGKAEGEELNK